MPTPRGADRLLVFAALLLAALFTARAVALLASPLPLEYGEGTTWAYAHLMATRGSYFLPIATEPFIHGTYPPVFPRLQAALGGTLRAGRALALLGSLLAAASLAGILRVKGVGLHRALLWAVLLLATPSLHEWAATCRVDSLALGFSLLGLYVATRFEGKFPVLFAILPFALALLTKQVAVAAPLAVFLALVARGQRREAALFAGALGVAVLGALVVLHVSTGGESTRHLVSYTAAAGFAPGPVLRFSLRLAFVFPVLLPMGLRGLGPHLRSCAGIYVLTSLGLVVLTGKPGAGANYLIEPGAGILLAGALAAEKLLAQRAASPDRRADLVLLLVVQAVVLCGPGRPLELHDLLRDRPIEARAVELLRDAPGPVLSEDLGLTLAAGKEPYLEPFQFGLLAKAGLFDPAPVLLDLRAGRFGVVLVGWRLRALPGLEAALRERYDAVESFGPYEVWRPR